MKWREGMRKQKVIKTTLGDLVAAVTDEVTASMGNTSEMYVVVSYIVSQLMRRKAKARHGAQYQA
jgi:hypothetical protein